MCSTFAGQCTARQQYREKLRFVRNITQWLGEAQFAGLYRFHIKCIADGQAIARLMIIEQRSSRVESGDFPNFTAFQVLSHCTVRKHENMRLFRATFSIKSKIVDTDLPNPTTCAPKLNPIKLRLVRFKAPCSINESMYLAVKLPIVRTRRRAFG